MATVEWHSLAWPNMDARMLNAQSAVLDRFGIPVRHTREQIVHGVWMDTVMRHAQSDMVGFFDVDCVPTNADIIGRCSNYVAKHKSFIGLAQVSNHIGHRNHIFAAPSFFLIWRQCWLDLRRPTFMAIKRKADVAENVSFEAERAGLSYRALYPSHYEKDPPGSIWYLANYGRYGVGTTYHGGFYHLYNSRFNENIELFHKRCEQIVAGTFTTEGMIPSRSFDTDDDFSV